MLKKIALAGIFAVTSLVSFVPSTVNAQQPRKSVGSSVKSPEMKGFCGAMVIYRNC